jgi:hypothetical protein
MKGTIACREHAVFHVWGRVGVLVSALAVLLGQNPNPSLTVAFPLLPAADMPAVLVWAALCH